MKIKIIYLSVFFAFLLPFGFYTDFFPFLRLGMFSEKPSNKSQQVIYSASVQMADEEEIPIEELLGPFKKEHWHYIIRKYQLKNNLNDFFQIINSKVSDDCKIYIYEENAFNSHKKIIAKWPNSKK